MEWTDRFNWFAIQAKPCQEAVAERTLASLELETLLPRAREDRHSRRSRRPGGRPLFRGYLFSRFCPDRHLHAVRYSRGVCRVVGASDCPWPVENEIIAGIRERTDRDGFVRLEDRSWRPGQAVCLQEGPLRGWTGVFDRELDDHGRVVILLDAIRQARAVVERRWLQLA